MLVSTAGVLQINGPPDIIFTLRNRGHLPVTFVNTHCSFVGLKFGDGAVLDRSAVSGLALLDPVRLSPGESADGLCGFPRWIKFAPSMVVVGGKFEVFVSYRRDYLPPLTRTEIFRFEAQPGAKGELNWRPINH